MLTLQYQSTKPYTVEVELNGIPVAMELDIGAAVSIINESTFSDLQKSAPPSLQPSASKLRTYTGQSIEVLGVTQLQVRYKTQDARAAVHVVKGNGPNLMGRDWLAQINIDFKDIHVVNPDIPITSLLNKYATVFGSDLGCLKGAEIKLSVHNDANPKFYKPRPVPLVYKEKVSEELDNLQQQGIISPVLFSPWAAPIVPVLKKIMGKIDYVGITS